MSSSALIFVKLKLGARGWQTSEARIHCLVSIALGQNTERSQSLRLNCALAFVAKPGSLALLYILRCWQFHRRVFSMVMFVSMIFFSIYWRHTFDTAAFHYHGGTETQYRNSTFKIMVKIRVVTALLMKMKIFIVSFWVVFTIFNNTLFKFLHRTMVIKPLDDVTSKDKRTTDFEWKANC